MKVPGQMNIEMPRKIPVVIEKVMMGAMLTSTLDANGNVVFYERIDNLKKGKAERACGFGGHVDEGE